MRTVAVTFIGVLCDYGPEVLFVAVRMSLGFLALVSCAKVAILDVFLLLKFLEGQLLFISFEFLEVLLDSDLVYVFKQ